MGEGIPERVDHLPLWLRRVWRELTECPRRRRLSNLLREITPAHGSQGVADLLEQHEVHERAGPDRDWPTIEALASIDIAAADVPCLTNCGIERRDVEIGCFRVDAVWGHMLGQGLPHMAGERAHAPFLTLGTPRPKPELASFCEWASTRPPVGLDCLRTRWPDTHAVWTGAPTASMSDSKLRGWTTTGTSTGACMRTARPVGSGSSSAVNSASTTTRSPSPLTPSGSGSPTSVRSSSRSPPRARCSNCCVRKACLSAVIGRTGQLRQPLGCTSRSNRCLRQGFRSGQARSNDCGLTKSWSVCVPGEAT